MVPSVYTRLVPYVHVFFPEDTCDYMWEKSNTLWGIVLLVVIVIIMACCYSSKSLQLNNC